jgi:hypothetical protein
MLYCLSKREVVYVVFQASWHVHCLSKTYSRLMILKVPEIMRAMFQTFFQFVSSSSGSEKTL